MGYQVNYPVRREGVSMRMTRRSFVGSLGGCAAHVLWMSAGGGAASRLWAAQPLGKVVETEP